LVEFVARKTTRNAVGGILNRGFGGEKGERRTANGRCGGGPERVGCGGRERGKKVMTNQELKGQISAFCDRKNKTSPKGTEGEERCRRGLWQRRRLWPAVA
jgi:hypothetical protein